MSPRRFRVLDRNGVVRHEVRGFLDATGLARTLGAGARVLSSDGRLLARFDAYIGPEMTGIEAPPTLGAEEWQS